MLFIKVNFTLVLDYSLITHFITPVLSSWLQPPSCDTGGLPHTAPLVTWLTLSAWPGFTVIAL